MTFAMIVLVLVTLERLGELWLSRRNTLALLAKGAFEVAPGHYLLIVILHTAWLGGLWLLARENPVNLGWLGVFLILQLLRVWTLATLGPRWTTRIIILPGAPLVTSGPYRFLSHPNYCVVVCEIAVLPLCLEMPLYALAFSLANAAILGFRIDQENKGLRVNQQQTSLPL